MPMKEPRHRVMTDEEKDELRSLGVFEYSKPQPRFDNLSVIALCVIAISGSILLTEVYPNRELYKHRIGWSDPVEGIERALRENWKTPFQRIAAAMR